MVGHDCRLSTGNADGVHAVSYGRTRGYSRRVCGPSTGESIAPRRQRAEGGRSPACPLPAVPCPGQWRGGRRAAVAESSAAPINTELQQLQRTDDDVVMTTGSTLRDDRSSVDSSVILWGVCSVKCKTAMCFYFDCMSISCINRIFCVRLLCF